jgi:RNA polymerase-binding transcription factor DksA
MAKKDKKAAKPAKKGSKSVKKAAKPAPKKAAKPVKKQKPAKAKPVAKKPAAKKPVKPVKAKKVEKKVAKPSKPVAKKPSAPAKPSPKETSKAPAKGKNKEAVKTVKDLKKSSGKPIDAIKKPAKPLPKGKKSGKKGGDEEDDDEEVDVKDDYEKAEDEDEVVDGGELDEPPLMDVEAEAPIEDDDDDDEVPIKKGRGRRKKSEGKSGGGSMEAYIRNRPLQIDLTKPLIKKQMEDQPKPFVNTKDNRSRYTDKELAEFKELILQKLKEAQTDYELLKQTLSNEDNHGTDDTSPTFKLLEDGSDVLSKEETAQLAARQEKYIINLKNALVRIENKTYGICRATGKLIPKERLRSVPHATLGIDAKLNQNR